MSPRKILFAHQFALERVTGVTVTLVDLLRRYPLADGTVASFVSYENTASPVDFELDVLCNHKDSTCLVGFNIHIEVSFDFSLGLVAWCTRNKIVPYVYVVDYWPHHRNGLETLVAHWGVSILAATPFIHSALRDAGFHATLVQSGVPFLDESQNGASFEGSRKIVASIARLGPRKRLVDVIRAFSLSSLGPDFELYLKVLPTQTFASSEDSHELEIIEREIENLRLLPNAVRIDRVPVVPQKYGGFSIYVCSSSYEGFSLSPIQAAYVGCPPLISAIPPHLRTAQLLFENRLADFVYPVGDCAALSALMRDELRTGRRRDFLHENQSRIRSRILDHFSMDSMAKDLAELNTLS